MSCDRHRQLSHHRDPLEGIRGRVIRAYRARKSDDGHVGDERYETAVIVRRRSGGSDSDFVWQFLAKYRIDIVPFDDIQARAAAAAYDRYGKGIDPTARLNLADCAAYALAKSLGAPLLFKGGDFAATDIRPAA